MVEEKKKSSYEKGIIKLLQKREGFEWVISSYIVDTNTKFRSNVFPSTQIAKILLDKLGKKKTQFAVFHKIVREIFKIWNKEELCEYISKGTSSKKTKEIYKITDYGLTAIKAKIIGFNIQNIKGSISEEFEPHSSSREQLLKVYLDDVIDEMDNFDDEDEDDEFEDEE
ncbi:MAG: hypothetical protein GY870_19185 [archaeon]|nr:hypothetical protein [archaeon]